MARYGQKFKNRVVVSRLLQPESATLEAVVREIGVGVAPLDSCGPIRGGAHHRAVLDETARNA